MNNLSCSFLFESFYRSSKNETEFTATNLLGRRTNTERLYSRSRIFHGRRLFRIYGRIQRNFQEEASLLTAKATFLRHGRDQRVEGRIGSPAGDIKTRGRALVHRTIVNRSPFDNQEDLISRAPSFDGPRTSNSLKGVPSRGDRALRAPHRANHAFPTVIYLRPFRPCSFIASFSPFFNVGPASPGAIDILAINKESDGFANFTDPGEQPRTIEIFLASRRSTDFPFCEISAFPADLLVTLFEIAS